jgi:hypothetical protein
MRVAMKLVESLPSLPCPYQKPGESLVAVRSRKLSDPSAHVAWRGLELLFRKGMNTPGQTLPSAINARLRNPRAADHKVPNRPCANAPQEPWEHRGDPGGNMIGR